MSTFKPLTIENKMLHTFDVAKYGETSNILFSELTELSTPDIYDFFHKCQLSGVHKPSYYTISSLIQLYGSICKSVLINNEIAAVSLNCPDHSNSSVYVYAFAVKEQLQGNGIGSALFRHMTDEFKKMRYKFISLRVLSNNNAALNFWGNKGFSQAKSSVACCDDEFHETYLELSL